MAKTRTIKGHISATQGRGKRTSQGEGNVSTSTMNKSVGHVVEKLDETFVVKIDDNPLTFWEEILLTVREN